jgi:hypothetical protein
MVAWARERVPTVDGRVETEKFVNYWRGKAGKDATKLDWPATWRNWMLNAAERNGARASPSNAPKSIPPAERCEKHPNYRRDRCGPCRSERGAANTDQTDQRSPS